MSYTQRAQESVRRGGEHAARIGLYRDTERGVVAGVCAGMARYFNVDLKIVRILMVLGLVFFSWPFLIAYIVAAVVLNKQPKSRPSTAAAPPAAARAQDPVANAAPPPSMADVDIEYDALEDRLRGLEAYLSSKRFELDREFKHLEGA